MIPEYVPYGNVVYYDAPEGSVGFKHLDHIVPYCRNGDHSLENSQLLQWKANLICSDRTKDKVDRKSLQVGLSIEAVEKALPYMENGFTMLKSFLPLPYASIDHMVLNTLQGAGIVSYMRYGSCSALF